mmetsp:Transcript_20221/g.26722  ORF Transcript_20221/g.26722 Transcript_20221/m.26722 type:complete len:81 (+) Transcript_20221:1173-1415(+)
MQPMVYSEKQRIFLNRLMTLYSGLHLPVDESKGKILQYHHLIEDLFQEQSVLYMVKTVIKKHRGEIYLQLKIQMNCIKSN